MTKVAGDVKFSVNIGAAVKSSQDAARAFLFDPIKRIESDRGVTFELGREVGTTPTQLDSDLVALIEDTAGAIGIATRRMPTVGHDAAMFARAGIPSAVILVRNAHGSHNSDEALDRKDFAAGVHVLGRAMHRLANAQ
jgi:N-carbamoyl-L-amino-acid hydrolase